MKYPRLLVLVALLAAASFALSADSEEAAEDSSSSQGGMIISQYLKATRSDAANAGLVEVDIDANVPKLKQHGRLRALRKISDVGKITYRVLGFQGDSSVKNQVIARYLQAEQQGQDDKVLTLTPGNYKFKLRGERVASSGNDVYVFQVSPREKRVGLFKGEVWLDTKTYLPVYEKGRLVKNPSIFFRKVDFDRDFSIRGGASVPAHMNSTIDTRLVGKVSLSVAYSSPTAAPSGTVGGTDSATPTPASFLP